MVLQEGVVWECDFIVACGRCVFAFMQGKPSEAGPALPVRDYGESEAVEIIPGTEVSES